MIEQAPVPFGLHIKENWHTFCSSFAIRNLCMTIIRHATTGSNMKHLTFYPGASPHARSLFGKWPGYILACCLALTPVAVTYSQVTITCPSTITISCNVDPSPANTGTATASSSCPISQAVTLTYQDDNSLLNGCMGTGVLKRTWTATDVCGAASSCIQNIIIEDNTSPTLSCPSFVVISCDSDTTPANLGMAIASDNCTPTALISISYTDHTENLNQCNGTGSFTRHWQAEDMCGNIAACIQTIVITDNQAPQLTLPPSITISCEQNTDPSTTGTATAIDNCTDAPTVTFSDNVFGLTGCSGTGTIVRTWSSIDACNNIQTGTQFITIVDQTAPSITCPPDLTISCESSILPQVTGQATASDLCGAAFIGYSDQATLNCNGTGIIQRTWSAIDGCSNVSTCMQIITITDLVAPLVSCPPNITLDCAVGIDPTVSGQPTISDNCTSAINLEVSHTDVELIPLGCNGTGTIERTWQVTDACGNSTSCVQTITITDLLKPTIICPPPATISCESSTSPDFTGAASASDNCTPVGSVVISYTDDESSLFGCNGTGILYRMWSATDLCGNVSTCVQQIWITDDIDPTLPVRQTYRSVARTHHFLLLQVLQQQQTTAHLM